MELNPRRRRLLIAHHWLFIVLILALTALLAFVAHEYRYERDLTHASRNTLSAATLDVLKQLDGPVNVTAFAMAQTVRGQDVHKWIREMLRVYQRAKPDIVLKIVDPREDPKAAVAAGVQTTNELLIEYRKRSERLNVAELNNEQAVANALMRLARGAQRLVLWLEGHGERRLNGSANHDLGEFGRQLQQKGFHLNSLNLALAQEVPSNAALLVVAGPQVDLLQGEVDKIKRHLGSGNLLWLLDPGSLRGMEPVAETLGLVLTPGVVVDPEARRFNTAATIAVGASYGRHPITNVLSKNTFFPVARQITTTESEEWRITPLVEVAPRGWVETGKLEGNVTFDKNRDFAGPVNVATAFERSVGDKSQRVVVVGTGEFLANAYLGNLGNLDLGVNIINWLAGDDRMITIQPRAAPDSSLDIEPFTLYAIAFTFLLGLPLAFVIMGALIWWRRRKI
jgi:gliding motility-associatede transport system auxiliary component